MESQPLKMAWITDFTLKCSDRNILVVKECLVRVSTVFKSMFETNQQCSIVELNCSSEGIHRIMKIIHVFPYTGELPNMPFKFEDCETDMLNFCFEYKIGSIFSHLRGELNKALSHDNSIKWLPFLRSFKNQDGNEIFEQEIHDIRHLIINNDKIEEYIEVIENCEHKDSHLADIYVIMRVLKQGSTKPESEGKNKIL